LTRFVKIGPAVWSSAAQEQVKKHRPLTFHPFLIFLVSAPGGQSACQTWSF